MSGKRGKHNNIISQGAKVAQPPGTLIYLGNAPAHPSRLVLMSAGITGHQVVVDPSDEQLKDIMQSQGQHWLQVHGINDSKNISRLGEIFALHPLVLEDILDTTHRPKADDYGNYLFVTLKIPRVEQETGERWLEQLSMVLGSNYVISFQDSSSSILENIEKRMQSPKWWQHKHTAGYLLYTIVDAVIDNYYGYYEAMQDDYENLEMQVLQTPTPDSLQQVIAMKHETITVRKTLWPLRDIVTQLERNAGGLMPDGIGLYLRDISDHVMQLLETAESIHDLMSVTMDIYLSSTNNRINEVMKVLTIFASLFMPLTFLTSLYGMNFDFMPELHIWWAYPALLVIMLCVVCGMLLFFRRRKWF